MQHEIVDAGPLLDEAGRLTEPGYARDLILTYDRAMVKAHSLRLKEWDYYYVGNRSFGVALTIADNSYMGLDSISLLDFEEGWEITKSPMQVLTRGRKQMPSSSHSGDVYSAGNGYLISFEHRGDRRLLSFTMERFKGKKPIRGELELFCPPQDSIVIATPFFGDEKAFYYNQKINCMAARGSVYFDGREYRFTPKKSCAVLDWGRGVWTYKKSCVSNR